MKAYIVRVIETRMIVGLFCADDVIELHYWVDTVADPGACEYRRMGGGGIVWEGKSPVVPLNADENSDDGEEQRALEGASLTESWASVMFDTEDSWKPMGPMQYGRTADMVRRH